ncbi:MAG: hypothetical protein L0Y76_07735, partial [Ignavibacteria bacterium]|nr:hypothetical protein [Ignavibacteria bacterium]
MNDMIKLLDKSSAIEAVNKLGEEDLSFLNRLIVERLRLIHQMKSSMTMKNFSAGDRVNFTDSSGKRVSGVVTRLNRKSVTVIADG